MHVDDTQRDWFALSQVAFKYIVLHRKERKEREGEILFFALFALFAVDSTLECRLV